MTKSALTFEFASPKDHYEADACIVWCFDFRFNPLLSAFINAEGIKKPDLIVIAGGAKSLANDANGSVRENVAWQINASNKLHSTKRVILMNHKSCGAYGLKVDEDAEYAKLNGDLIEAESYLRPRIPAEMMIEKYIADFDGLRKV